jgi:serine protease Do
MGVLEDLGRATEGAAARVAQSVVRVGRWRDGTGFVVGDGYVLTNAHNVRGDSIPLTFADGRQVEASVAGIDVDGDLAVLSGDTAAGPALEWADELPRIGSVVFAVTLAEAGPRLTLGTVSSTANAFRGPRGRPIAGGIEHTAPLAPGSSGSPLTDADGRVVGINTNRLGAGFYVALPANADLRRRVDELTQGKSVERPRLGVGVLPAAAARRLRRAVGLPERDGVLVREVEGASPAQAAGIREGDLLVEANGAALRRVDDLYAALASHAGDGSLTLRVVRGAEEHEVVVDFAKRGGGERPIH